MINEVQKYPTLYDTKRKDYKDAEKKKNIWTTISSELEIHDPKLCETKWTTLKTQFSHERARRKKPSGDKAKRAM